MSGDNRLKVLIGMPFAAVLGGAERYLEVVADEAPAHGLDLHVVFLAGGPMADDFRRRDIRTTVVPLGRFRDLRQGRDAVRRVRAIVERERPDVVFSWLPRAHVYMAPAAWLAGVPVDRIAWWQHHVPDGEILERTATAIPAGAVFVASETVAAAQLELRPRRRVALTPCGIAAPAPVSKGDLDSLRARLGIPSGRVIAGLPGRLVEWKGQDRFLDAIARLRERGRDVHALVVGGPGHGPETHWHRTLRGRAEAPALRGAVTFTGHVGEPVPYIQLMDVLVNASEPEPFGLTLVEAQALEVPVVAVDAGGPREIVEHGRSGWLVPSGAPGDLAAGIEAVLDDASLRARMAAEGRTVYERRWTAAAGVERFAAALRQLAER